MIAIPGKDNTEPLVVKVRHSQSRRNRGLVISRDEPSLSFLKMAFKPKMVPMTGFGIHVVIHGDRQPLGSVLRVTDQDGSRHLQELRPEAASP